MENLKNEIVIIPNGGGTIYINEIININNKFYAVCTPLVPSDNLELREEVDEVLEDHPEAIVIYLYELVDRDDYVEVINPESTDLEEVISAIKELDFLTADWDN